MTEEMSEEIRLPEQVTRIRSLQGTRCLAMMPGRVHTQDTEERVGKVDMGGRAASVQLADADDSWI